MKTQNTLLTFLFLLGACAGSLQCAEPSLLFVPAATDAVHVIRNTPDVPVQIGSMREEVLAQFGEPPVRINRDSWAYPNVSLQASRGMEAYDTLIVTLKNTRVTGLYLIKHSALAELISTARREQKGFDFKRTILALNRG